MVWVRCSSMVATRHRRSLLPWLSKGYTMTAMNTWMYQRCTQANVVSDFDRPGIYGCAQTSPRTFRFQYC